MKMENLYSERMRKGFDMKMDMYKEVPEGFHKRLIDTLEQLEEPETARPKRRKRLPARKLVMLTAAAVLLLGTMTVGAVELFQWQKRAAEKFGVEGELENKLTAQGVAVEESAAAEGEITLQALQTVRSDRAYYILLRVTLPDGIVIDEDTVFDSMEVWADEEFNGGTVNFVSNSAEGNSCLCEIELLTVDGVDYTGQEVVLKLKDLIQTTKTEQVGEPLVEGEWELALTLTAQLPDTKEYYADSAMKWGDHCVQLRGVRVNSFGVELIADREQSLHASQNHSLKLSGVEYEDGTVVSEESYFLRTADEESGIVFSVSFEETGEAVDVDKISALILDDGAERITLSAAAAGTEAGKGVDSKTTDLGGELPWKDREETMKALYVSQSGYAVVTDGVTLWLWDMSCGRIERALSLSEVGYDSEKGEILVGAGGHMAYIFPDADGGLMYIYRFAADMEGEQELIERPADDLSEETKAVYRSYQEEKNLFDSGE